MTDFTPTPEAVETVVKALERHVEPAPEAAALNLASYHSEMARDAIAAFVEAEGLKTEERPEVDEPAKVLSWGDHQEDIPGRYRPAEQRLVGPWRKRD